MAKDKEKQLFEDKAITFQRAVFIVCNLRRIIKRPKKNSDKCSLGATNRKRSGGGDETHDRSSSGLLGSLGGGADCEGVADPSSAGAHKLRFRDPIRRAFTLPTIICGSFAGVVKGADDQEPDVQQQQREGERDELGANDPLVVAGEKSQATRLRFWPDVELASRKPPGSFVAESCTRNNSPTTSTPTGASSAAASRQASPVSFSGFQQSGRSLGAGAGRQLRPLGDNLSSLSCLATPVRTRGQRAERLEFASPANTPTSNSSNLSASSIVATSGRLSSLARGVAQTSHQRTADRHGNSTLNQQAAAAGRQLWCPIWALAMELLDASQTQPRNQSSHTHLLGAPSGQPFLLAPQEATSGSADEQESFAYLFDASSSGRHKRSQRPAVRVTSSNSDDSDREQAPCDTHKRYEHNNGRAPDLAGAKVIANSSSQARMSMKRFSSSALCLNEADGKSLASSRKSPADRKHRQRPVIVLDEQHEQFAALGVAEHRQTAVDRRKASNSSTRFEAKRESDGKSASPSLLAAPEDPIVQLARQRRPSASNQGSINVDQQALFSAVERNQLERTKTILDKANVNVNSLNGDKLTCLDVAVLLRDVDMVRLLQDYQAKESSAYLTREGRENQLYALYIEARRLVEDLSRSIGAIAPGEHDLRSPAGQLEQSAGGQQATGDANQSAAGGGGGEQQLMLATGSLLSSALFEEKQRQLHYWKRRLDLFMQMRYGFSKLEVPNAPELAVLQVVGESSLGVKIVHSLQFSELLGQQQQQQQQPPPPQQLKQSIKRPDDHPATSGQEATPSAAEPLAGLTNLVRERHIECPLGLKCSHWLMDEFRALKHSDQLLNTTSTGGNPQDFPADTNFQLPLPAFERPSRSGSTRTHQASGNTDNNKQQDRLAVFNYLLAQQLAILSNEQRQQQAQELLEQNNYLKLKRSQQFKQHQLELDNKVGRQAHNRQLALAHQIESTDSVYEHIMAASMRQQQQQQVNLLAINPTYSLQMTNSPSFNLSASSRLLATGGASSSTLVRKQGEQRPSQRQPLAYHSLAYQLMSARRYNTSNFCNSSAIQYTQMGCEQAGAMSALASANIKLTAAAAAAAAAIAASSAASDPNKMIVITKYKVEWSPSELFESPLNSMIIYNTQTYPIECQINELAIGRPFYVRVSSGNQKGFSETRSTTPLCLAPSSWRQVPTGLGHKISGSGKRKLKYDEQVFKKFTKLILLNKHILEEHQINLLQREQHHLLTTGLRTTLGKSAAKRAGLQPGALQNKSSLINMLLLDATMPTIVSGRSVGEPLQISSAAHSPRGSLYPVDPATGPDGELQHQQHQPGLKVKKNFKNFFQSNSAKFYKLNNQNKRGLYLTSVIYHNQSASAGQSAKQQQHQQQKQKQSASENRIVVTNDDRLPVIEIMNDLVSPSNLMADFYWLLKINGTKWIDIKRLRQQLQKSHSSSTLHLRIKLLNAIEQMQLALNLEDIGRLFYKPIQAHDGSIVICTCKQVASLKMVSNLSIKWTAQHKLIPSHLRKISDAITLQWNQQRELQQQQTTAPFTSLMPTAANSERHSSTTTSGSSTTTGSGRGDLEIAATSQQQQQTALAMRQEQSSVGGINLISSSSVLSSALAMNLAADPNCTANQQQSDLARLLAANAPELSRLCESCQQALIQRRCTMASASSSSSLVSSESQSTWSSSQFSLSSQAPQQQHQQQLSGARSCTCSRSNSATIQVNSPVSSSNTPTPTQGHSNQLLATNAAQSYGLTASAPGSQRNSSSARSSSGSVMMLMTPAHRHQSGGSLSAAPGMFAASGSSFSSASGQSAFSAPFTSVGQRQTQSQHLCASSTQKSSTYLMLASLSPYDLLLFHLKEIIDFDQSSVVPLKRGLYLGFIQLQTTVESMRLLVPRMRPNMIPCTRIRDNAHVSREEWQLLKEFGPLFGGSRVNFGHKSCCASQVHDEAKMSKLGQASKSSSSRSSDPAIWSASTATTAVQRNAAPNQLQSDCSLLGASLNSTSGGFERDRAKSVSPGLVGAAEPGEASLAQLGRAKLLAVDAKGAAIVAGQRDEKMALSDGDLQATELGSAPRSELRQSDSSNLLQVSELEDSRESLGTDGKQRQQRQRQRRSSKAKRHSQIGAGQSPEMTFVRLIGDAAKRLLCELKSQLPKSFDHDTSSWRSLLASLNEEQNNRVYHIELIELSNQVTFVLLIPTAENICPVTSHDKSDLLTNNNNSDYMLLPLQIFETIHLNTYEPDLLGKYSRLSTILETDLIVAQHDHRQAFSSNELNSTKSRVSRLQDMVAIADEFWRQLRWIVDVVSFARDKTQLSVGDSQASGASAAPGCLKVGLIWRHFDSLSSYSPVRNAAGTVEDSSPISQRDISARRREEEELDEEAKDNEGRVDSDEWRRTRRGLEVKRTLSARQRQQPRPARGQAACDHSSAAPIGAGHHYLSSGALNDYFGPTKAKPKPPRLPQIQLPSSEARDSTDSSSPGADGSMRTSGVKRRKSSARVGRLLSAGSAPRRPRQLSGETEPPPTAPSVAGGRRYSDQGSGKAPCDASGHTSRSSVIDDCGASAHYYAPGQQRRDEANNRLAPDEGETCFEESILNVEFDKCLRQRSLGSGFREGDGHGDEDWSVERREVGGPSFSEAPAHEQDDVDEEAIYAYHISLRDATKRAARRKSSQHSINVFLVEGEEKLRCTSSSSGQAQTNPLDDQLIGHAKQAVSKAREPHDGTQMIEFELAGRSRQLSTNVIDLKFMQQQRQQPASTGDGPAQAAGPLDWGEDVTYVSSEDGTRRGKITGFASNGQRTLSHFKTNNPFLSDSLDL